MQRAVKSRVEIEIPTAELFIDDGAHFPGPGVGGKWAALVADLVGEAKAYRPFPFFWYGNARTDVVADPLNALAAALVGKDVEADLEPVGETVGNFDSFVQGVVGGIKAVFDGFGAVDGEIAVELKHGVVGIDEIGAVDLNFVVVLSAGGY